MAGLMMDQVEEGRQDQQMVGAVLAILLCLLLFFVAQRYLIQGVVITGVEK